MHIGIVADDLTGAADALAPFARMGFHASVGFELKHTLTHTMEMERFPLADGDALAYDTATRDVPREQLLVLQRTVRRAAHRLATLAPRVVFKKIDSTLRGHLRAELGALRAEFPDRMAIVCPAFPAQGRTVQTGVLHIHNVPWTSTEFAPSGIFASLTVRDAFGFSAIREPVRSQIGSEIGSELRSEVKSELRSERSLARPNEAAEIGIGMIREGAEALETRLMGLRANGVMTAFCDAAQQSDLLTLAQTILRAPELYLAVGAAGLTRALAEAFPPLTLATTLFSSPNPPLPFAHLEQLVQPFVNGRVLVIVGSLHAASRRQRRLLANRLEAPPVVLDDTQDHRTNVERAVDQIRAHYVAGRQIVLLTTPDVVEPGHAEDFALLAGSVVWRIGLWGQSAGLPLDGLVVCGGDTARELCRACNGTGLRIDGEWQPGVAIGRLRAEPDPISTLTFNGLPIITKAGGFGDDQTLARCVGLI